MMLLIPKFAFSMLMELPALLYSRLVQYDNSLTPLSLRHLHFINNLYYTFQNNFIKYNYTLHKAQIKKIYVNLRNVLTRPIFWPLKPELSA